jgi:hypothetical protein
MLGICFWFFIVWLTLRPRWNRQYVLLKRRGFSEVVGNTIQKTVLVTHCVRNVWPQECIPSQTDPVHTLTTYFSGIHFNIKPHLGLGSHMIQLICKQIVNIITSKYSVCITFIMWRIYAMQELRHRNTFPRLRNIRRSGVFSVPSRAEPWQVAHRLASRRIASPRLLPGNSYKHLDNARVGKGHVTASAVTQQLKRFPACHIKGL